MKYLTSMTVLAVLCMGSILHAQATAPAANGEPLKVVITGVEGNVQARMAADDKWQPATVNMELKEGAELRTGVRSAVRFTIPPDQTITLDRLGTLQILRANFENGKIMTDLGMKFGRTRYDIEDEGRPHDAKVHSPSAVLAIRGTQVNLYDQPPFAPEATSLSRRAYFRDIKKEVSFGGQGKTKITPSTETPAAYAKGKTASNPRGNFNGNSQTDDLLQLSLASYGGNDFSNLGVLAFLDAAKAGSFKGTVIGVLPIPRQLAFTLFWSSGTSFNDLDLTVRTPTGQTFSTNDTSLPSNVSVLGSTGDQSGSGGESIVITGYKSGKYTYTATLKTGATSGSAGVVVVDDPINLGTQIDFSTGTLTTRSPTLTKTITAPASSTPTAESSVSKSKTVQKVATAVSTPKPAKTRAAR